ncbi:L,D-transpeptidase [Anabaena azotica]|uniref:L,D-transpeptidase n=1 Tax=Anabaena azotica FACHB-119 TaxID=947527 RepID=A0ABR8D7M7_9NOST|nr:L,D-transpeptidase [Anabaena azotica]MBD2503159.1 L,D-transpeptidase [Anabaena azotica FACHB-119]
MKSLNWKRGLKMFVAGAALSLFVVNTGGEALAKTNPQKLAKTIETLQKSDQRWIQVDLSQQRLTAWQGRKPVYAIAISSGKTSTPTPIGTFRIQSKHKSTRMRGRGYDLPNVPYAMFYSGNYGIHGAYWHKRFGTPVSRGCVNLAPNHAKWLFNWASLGTPVVVQR